MKTYVLDTNIFFLDSNVINRLEGNKIIIPTTVLEELDNHKGDAGLNGFNVRKSLRNIENNLDKVVILEPVMPIIYDMGKNDNKIIAVAKESKGTLLSNDANVRIKAKSIGVNAEEYKAVRDIELGELRTGKHTLKCEKLLSTIYTEGFDKFDYMYENDFVLFEIDGQIKDIGIVKNGKVVKCKIWDKSFYGSTPKNLEQKLALTHLYNSDLELVTFTGSAGTSKSYMMLAVALDLIEKGVYDKLYIAKSPISLDKSLEVGFLKGDLKDKLMPSLGSITSNLYNMANGKNKNKSISGAQILEGLEFFGKVEVVSMEYILGTSLPPKSVVLLDEAQVLNLKTTNSVFTRLGENSVIFATGDLKQSASNNIIAEDTGLFKVINAFAGYEKSAHLTLETVHRSGFVAEYNKRMGE